MYVTERDFDTLKFAQIKELRPEVWSGLSDAKKIEALQECSNRICDFENRPRSVVEIVDFNKQGPQNEGFDAGFNPKSNVIGISPEYLKSAGSYEIFRILIHESMHGYQHHAINNPGFHKNILDVNEWKEGDRQYVSPNENYREYKRNSLEAHSDVHASQFARMLKHEHNMQKAQAQLDAEAAALKQNDNPKTPKIIQIKQVSDNHFQMADPATGQLKTYAIDVPKGKTLEEVIKSNPHLISHLNNLEKGQQLNTHRKSASESTNSKNSHHQTVDTSNKNADHQNQQKEKKPRDFER